VYKAVTPPLEVGDRVRWWASSWGVFQLGFVRAVLATTVEIETEAGETIVRRLKGVTFDPTPETLAQRIAMVRDSRQDPELRLRLQLPLVRGTGDADRMTIGEYEDVYEAMMRWRAGPRRRQRYRE